MSKQMTSALAQGDQTDVMLVSSDGQVVETICSTEVAEMVEVEHSKLLRSIRTYSEYLNQANIGLVDFFIESTYRDAKGEIRPCYQITKKGCEMIANKLTGQKGIIFTAKYIERFHMMKDYIVHSDPFAGLSDEMKMMITLDKRSVEQEVRITRLEDNIHITRLQKKQLREFINVIVVNACGSKYSKAFKEFGKKAYSAVYHDLYNAFGINSYEELPKIKFQDALAFINRWKPNRELELLIKASNMEVQNE